MIATMTGMRTRKVWQVIRACWQHAACAKAYIDRLVAAGHAVSVVEPDNLLRLSRSRAPGAKAHH